MSRRKPTRGVYAQIGKLIAPMAALADWFEKYKPDVRVLSLWPSDLQLIQRHPEIAARFRITVSVSGPPTWRGFCLMTAGDERRSD